MVRKRFFTSLLISSALALTVATPASAGKGDRAREAIAAAEAKIRTAESLGAGSELPRETAAAREALAIAREDLAAGRKSISITGAIRASAFADTAIGELQRRNKESVSAAQDAARDQAITAQQDAAEANARASAAEQAAASSAADAAAARNAAALAAQTPTQVETTVTTQQRGGVRRSTRTQVKRTTPSRAPVVVAPQVTTTTRVTQP